MHVSAVNVAEITRSIGSTKVRTRLCDKFSGICPAYLKDASAVFLVYDVCRRSTFKSLPNWLAVIRKFCVNDPVVVVIANKSLDSAREVSESEGAKFAGVNTLPLFENAFESTDALENALMTILTEIGSRDREAFRLVAK
jgi:Ras-related protein Rab-2A